MHSEHSNKILLVEDNAEIADCIDMVLSYNGYEVVKTHNGKEAIDYLRRHKDEKPGLILLDLMLPVMDGWEFLDQFKSEEEDFSKIPVVVTSAASEADKQTQVPVERYLKKPVKLDLLLQTVRGYCEPKQ